jgi:hypothetical protein
VRIIVGVRLFSTHLVGKMARLLNKQTKPLEQVALAGYDGLLTDVARVIEEAKRTAARAVNAIMTSTYWLVGRRIVEQEQHGAARAGYGQEIIERLSIDLQAPVRAWLRSTQLVPDESVLSRISRDSANAV